MHSVIPLIFLFAHENAVARSLIQSGNAAKSSLMSLGEAILVIGCIIVGILFGIGSERASSNAVKVIFGGAFIFGCTAIVAFVKGIMG